MPLLLLLNFAYTSEHLRVLWILKAKKRKKFKKGLDFLRNFCYNIGVAWRDGRVGLRRTTGNRVNPNRFHGFESHSLRHE